MSDQNVQDSMSGNHTREAVLGSLLIEQIDSSLTLWRQLSKRDQEVASYVAEGLPNKKIAGKMDFSLRLIEGSCSNLRKQLNLSRTELSAFMLLVRTGLKLARTMKEAETD